MRRGETAKVIELKSVNEFRNMAGYGDLNIRERKCLKCDKKFISKGNHNRLCDSCKSKDTYAYCQVPLATVHTNIKGEIL
ncbi:MAG: hypothetical protein CMD96_05945 [Gammaproteobacteria bacterium]|nr:hypothetical protein [Gammaproteobacteria bacterium]